MERVWLNLPYAVWAAICLAVALVSAFVWPRNIVGGAPRYAPPLAGALGPASGLGPAWRSMPDESDGQACHRGPGNIVGQLALPVYLGFFAALFVLR